MTSPSPSPSPATFPESELDQALSEQSFGITSYEIQSVSQLEAEARVVLLEGDSIRITLTSRGYEVVSDSIGSSDVFETIENLLHNRSQMYQEAKHKVLMDKLSLLA